MLEADAISDELANAEAWQIHCVEEVESTNDAVLNLAPNESALGSALFTESQTAGRGRRGNPWFGGPSGSNLLFSCAVAPDWPPEKWSRLTHITALVLKRVLESYPPADPRVKWPNDLYLDGKKVAGILVETEMRGSSARAVIGVGLNVNVPQDDLPPELQEIATSLQAVTRTWIPREILAASILDGLTESLTAPLGAFDSVLEELREAHYLLGRSVRARQGAETLVGTAIDLGPEGELILALPDDSHRTLASVDEIRLA